MAKISVNFTATELYEAVSVLRELLAETEQAEEQAAGSDYPLRVRAEVLRLVMRRMEQPMLRTLRRGARTVRQ